MRTSFIASLLAFASFIACASAQRPPNIIILFADDMAYADPACFGSKVNDTPNLDRMAKEGMRFTSFYSGAPVCSASRAALLTGCYPPRVGITGVLDHRSVLALHPDEVTIADLCKSKGYATALFGKWHLGHRPEHLPMAQGFDRFFGTPYSHDMWPFHPHAPSLYPDLPLLDGDRVVQMNPDPAVLTDACAERAVKFIAEHKEKPFFLYLPFNMPHVPLGVSVKHKGKSRNGVYGDVMLDIDAAVGAVLNAVREHKLERDTLVIFTSDNGPWAEYGNQAGDKGPLRGSKGSTWEGGVRVPMIAWQPGVVPAGTTREEVAAAIDVLPTVAKLIGAELAEAPGAPGGRVIDGRDIGPLLRGEANAKSPHASYFYCRGNAIEAVRSGDWKLHVQVTEAKDAAPQVKVVHLFDLKSDIGEQNDVAGKNPEVVKRLADEIQSFVESLRKNSREPARAVKP